MLIGKIPNVPTVSNAKANNTIPITPYYAELFADLAAERGFDGYLLNIEISLVGGSEQARALVAWISILREQIQKKVGPHGKVIWYDSVTVKGELRWQDRLNALNLPYFLSSDGIFTNYWVCRSASYA